MKYSQRRKETGKMLIDIVKYLVTIVIIGGLFTDKLTPQMATWGIISSIILYLLAFFTIPLDKEV